jgi:hypothetical protein
MKKISAFYFFIMCSVYCFTQNNYEIHISDLGIDSVYTSYLKLKDKQGSLSDCEFAKKIAKKELRKQNIVYYSDELLFLRPCLYCTILREDYNIKWRFSPNLFSKEYYNCYNEETSRLLKKTYNYDVFKRAYEKADSISQLQTISY